MSYLFVFVSGESIVATERGKGKHHMGDFLPPEELAKFQEKVKAIKEGRKADLSDYAEFKIKEDNIGYKLLQQAGWEEGKGLGAEGKGITQPINKYAFVFIFITTAKTFAKALVTKRAAPQILC